MQQADMDAMGLQYMYARAVACYWYTSGIQYSTSSIRNHMSVVGYQGAGIQFSLTCFGMTPKLQET